MAHQLLQVLYNTRIYFNMCSKTDISYLNLSHGKNVIILVPPVYHTDHLPLWTIGMFTRLESLEFRVSIFFLHFGKGISRLPRIETSDRPTVGPIVSGIIVTCRSMFAINRLLVFSLQPWPAYQMHRSVVYWGVYAGIWRIPTSRVFLTAYTHLSDHK